MNKNIEEMIKKACRNMLFRIMKDLEELRWWATTYYIKMSAITKSKMLWISKAGLHTIFSGKEFLARTYSLSLHVFLYVIRYYIAILLEYSIYG